MLYDSSRGEIARSPFLFSLRSQVNLIFEHNGGFKYEKIKDLAI